MDVYIEEATKLLNLKMDVYLLEARKLLHSVRNQTNTFCSKMDAFEIIVLVFCLSWALSYFWYSIRAYRLKGIRQRIKDGCFRQIRRIPYVRKKMEKELEKVRLQLETQLMEDLKGRTHRLELPEQGFNTATILKEIQSYIDMGHVKWEQGLVSGAVYKKQDATLEDLVMKVYGKMAYSNPLHPDVFPGLRKMEAEVVRMTLSMYKGAPDSCGTVTTGGTESIFLACKAYRDYAIARGINHPEMVIPITAHAAFDKSAQILQVKLKHIPVNPKTMQVDLRAMKKAITKNTCMLVGSTPQYSHGAVDPLGEIAKLGVKYNIPVHMDACLGGFLVPFIQEAGFDFPTCNFTVKGITSISADTHKYGYSPKGTSVVLYSEEKYRHYQYSVQPDWPGGIYATPNLGGSRAGGTIGACWASLMYFGKQGYVNSTKKIIETTRYIEKRLREIDGIFIYGNPQVSVIALGSKVFDIYRLGQALNVLGWNLNSLQFPSGFHLCVTQLHTNEGVADKFINDVKTSTKEIMKNPNLPTTGAAAIYGMAQSIPDRSFVTEAAWAFIDTIYSTKNV